MYIYLSGLVPVRAGLQVFGNGGNFTVQPLSPADVPCSNRTSSGGQEYR